MPLRLLRKRGSGQDEVSAVKRQSHWFLFIFFSFPPFSATDYLHETYSSDERERDVIGGSRLTKV